jgi:hypothetical protein
VPAVGIPSWSWTGWTGSIDSRSWQSGYDYAKRGDVGAGTSCETIPTTKWYAGALPSCGQRREVNRVGRTQKYLYQDPTQTLTGGWIRHASPGVPSGNTTWTYPDCPPPEGFGSCFYTHDTCPSWHFWYPVQLGVPDANLTIREPESFLFGAVEVAYFYTDGTPLHFYTPSVSLVDDSGQWAGVLRPHNIDNISHLAPSKKQPLQLVAISFGRAKNSEPVEHGLEEWSLDERPKNTFWYEFYNVMWISQDRGIAYREGIGRVEKHIWERRKVGKFDLVLG